MQQNVTADLESACKKTHKIYLFKEKYI